MSWKPGPSHLVVWRALRSLISWGPLGPQYTGRSVWGSQIKPSHRSAHCEEAAADTHTSNTENLGKSGTMWRHLSKVQRGDFNWKWSWFRCLIQSSHWGKKNCRLAWLLPPQSLSRFRRRKQRAILYMINTTPVWSRHCPRIGWKQGQCHFGGAASVSVETIHFLWRRYRGPLLEANDETQHSPPPSKLHA